MDCEVSLVDGVAFVRSSGCCIGAESEEGCDGKGESRFHVLDNCCLRKLMMNFRSPSTSSSYTHNSYMVQEASCVNHSHNRVFSLGITSTLVAKMSWYGIAKCADIPNRLRVFRKRYTRRR